MNWIAVNEHLPADGQRVLAYLPKNSVYLPGKSGKSEELHVIFLRFAKSFFAEGTSKCEKHGPHFWLGEGMSNHYFADVSHWMPVPEGPGAA